MKKQKSILPYTIAVILLSMFSAFVYNGGGRIRIFLIGDSTMADKPLADNPERGWGQMLPLYFSSDVEVFNYAKNGRSTKSFIDEGLWQKVEERLQPGDYLFIQFGHNDEKIKDPKRYTEPNTSFKDNLLKFVNTAKEKGAFPVLITPVNRRKFDKEGKLVDTHGAYTQAVRDAAKEAGVPLIDLYSESQQLFNKLGPAGTKKIFLWVPAGEYSTLPEGKQDNTHFNQHGAIVIAGLIAKGIEKDDLQLKQYLLPEDSVKDLTADGKNKIVGLDYYYNNERRKDKEGKEVRYHYIWEDTTNSGYSELGGIITDLNARLTEIKTAPTADILKGLSIYIIVDPDIPAENPNPNYIEKDAVNEIAMWVKNGGVLALFANDKGNCEFTHLNELAGKFGIHFNEDSRNRVKGRNFDEGKFDKFPDSPVFDGVKQIYLKEISTLKTEKPAEPLLTDKGDVIMAAAKYGKGFVFAVGDPWFYNEYIDNRKLPEGYENYKAAKNLFFLLLKNAEAVKTAR